jgi:hypothetical protein
MGCDEYGCPNGCCDGVCEPGCGCACGAPCDGCGCACEPGCGDDPCEKDCLCIGPGDEESCHTVKVRVPKWQEVVVFGGVQGFKGPYDRDRDSGNFGFNEGFNIGAKIPYAEMGYQFGWRGAQSQLNGDKDTGIEDKQSQHFHQIRSELGIRNGGCHEFGFDATVGLNSQRFDDGNGGNLVFQASDQYVLYYRLHGRNGGEGRIYAGANNDADGILGSDMLLPIGERFSFQGGFEYLVPNEKNGTDGATHEAWNIGLGLVWHWHAQARKCHDNCYRPMFNVADNGYLIVDQKN